MKEIGYYNLTPKELHFIELVLDGLPRSKAYREIYKPDTNNDDSIRAMASRVFNKQNVQEYYKDKYKVIYANKTYPRDRAIHEMLEHLSYMYENRSEKLADTIRKTIIDLDKLSNGNDEIESHESGLKRMFNAIHESIVK